MTVLKGKDLTGRRFGRLVVEKRVGRDKWGSFLWQCKCDCGGKAILVGSVLRKQKSCGSKKDRKERLIEDFTGRRYGRLVVLYRAANKGKRIAWACQCSCKQRLIIVVRGKDLKRGKTRSCGCLRRETTKARCMKNLAGMIFGKLTAIKESRVEHRSADGRRRVKWECLCECGNPTVVLSDNLMRGHIKSCGCNHAANAFVVGSILCQGDISPDLGRAMMSLIGLGQDIKTGKGQ